MAGIVKGEAHSLYLMIEKLKINRYHIKKTGG